MFEVYADRIKLFHIIFSHKSSQEMIDNSLFKRVKRIRKLRNTETNTAKFQYKQNIRTSGHHENINCNMIFQTHFLNI